jgi:transposase
MQDRPYILGVDVAKDTLSLCLRNAHDHSILDQREIPNQQKHIKGFLASAPVESLGSLYVAIEPTGSYWYAMADMALAMGCRVAQAPPRQAKKFLESTNLRAKNDKLDAKGLSLYATAMELRDYKPKSQSIRDLDELLALRRYLSQDSAYYDQMAKSDRAGCDVASQVHQTIKAQIAELDKRIATSQADFAPAKRLRGVPGFGPIVSAALASRLTTYDFLRSDSFVAYIGLDLKISDSGKKRGRRVLSKNGDPELRRLLYLAAQSSIKVKDSPFARIYQAHLDRGLKKPQAICIVARKMARTAWSIVRFETEYDPQRVLKDRKTLRRERELQQEA